MIVALIVAHDANRLIGIGPDIPWHDREHYADLAEITSTDLKAFKKRTTGHALIMGRRTWQSIGRPLPKRTNIVLTRDRSFTAAGAVVTHDLDAALAEVPDGKTAFVIGGGEIYELAFERADEIHRTVIHRSFGNLGDAANVYFPEVDEKVWERVEADELGLASMETLRRRG